MRTKHMYVNERILLSSIDVDELKQIVMIYPEIIKESLITDEDKISVLTADYSYWSKLINIDKCSIKVKTALFVKHPAKHKGLLKDLKLGKVHYSFIAVRKPTLFTLHKFPVDKLDGEAWCNLLRSDYLRYEPKFIAQINHINNVTTIRHVLIQYPRILALLTSADIEHSKLTAKQWMLLIESSDLKYSGNITKGIEYTPEVKEWIGAQLSMDVLIDPSIKTNVFKRASKKVLK